MSSARGLRVLKAIEVYRKKIPDVYDVSTVFNKINIASMSQGCAKGSFIVDISMCNSAKTLHGGYIASVMDALSFFSLLSNNDGRVCWTTNLNVDYFKIAKLGEKVVVETKLLQDGNTPAMETCLHNESGDILAKGTATFQAGNEKLQKLVKELVDFDVYEN